MTVANRPLQRILHRRLTPKEVDTVAVRPRKPRVLDFFAGSGLVTEALKPFFDCVWANDISKKKAAVYLANHRKAPFELRPIESVNGAELPPAELSWASFPCQDLSLAGNLVGIQGARSNLVWQWLRVMDEMRSRPPVVVAENVSGLVSAAGGEYYRILHHELAARGYQVGALQLDAIHWLPQSRPRVFVVGIDRRLESAEFQAGGPSWQHSPSIVGVARGLTQWVWWRIPKPRQARVGIDRLIEFNVPSEDEQWSEHNIGLIPPRHLQRLHAADPGLSVFPGYKRIRHGRQVLELRFDGTAGCLRTPSGGSSRQILVFRQSDGLRARLLTVREAARLMGVRDTYEVPGSYNDGYRAMGDAVAVPAVRHLGRHLIGPLARLAAVTSLT